MHFERGVLRFGVLGLALNSLLGKFSFQFQWTISCEFLGTLWVLVWGWMWLLRGTGSWREAFGVRRSRWGRWSSCFRRCWFKGLVFQVQFSGGRSCWWIGCWIEGFWIVRVWFLHVEYHEAPKLSPSLLTSHSFYPSLLYSKTYPTLHTPTSNSSFTWTSNSSTATL